MAERAIITKGDTTDHKGTVLEGHSFAEINGKQIASVGHMVLCPKCGGVFPILEGAKSVFYMGVNAAVAGMRTGCGAVLIASQDFVVIDDGTDAPADSMPDPTSALLATTARHTGCDLTETTQSQGFFFQVKDGATEKEVPNVPYKITLRNQQTLFGFTDQDGCTQQLPDELASGAECEAPYYDDYRVD